MCMLCIYTRIPTYIYIYIYIYGSCTCSAAVPRRDLTDSRPSTRLSQVEKPSVFKDPNRKAFGPKTRGPNYFGFRAQGSGFRV